MSNNTTNIIFLFLVALVALVGIFAYPSLPEQAASHWNAAGEVDDTMPKFWAIFLFVAIELFLYLLYWVIPKIDPLKKNIESFRKYYNVFWIFLALFMAYVFSLMIIWNLGFRFDFTFLLIPVLAVFFYLIGWILEKSKRNWFLGIRTPWTLSNDIVWEKTHQLGGKLFKLAALLSLAGLFFQDSATPLVIIAVAAAIIAVTTIVYSYFAYQKEVGR